MHQKLAEIVWDNRPPGDKKRFATVVTVKDPRASLFLSVLRSIRSDIAGHVIVVDDRSANREFYSLLEYDIDVLIHCKVNYGVAGAANIALEFCRSEGYEICFRSDADDQTLRGRAQASLAAFEKHPQAVLVGGLANDVTEDNDLIRVFGKPGVIRRGDRSALYPAMPCRHSTFAFHLQRLGVFRYDERFIFAQDYAALFDLNSVGDIVVVDRIMISYLTGQTRSYEHRRLQLLYRLGVYLSRGNWCLPRHYLALLTVGASFCMPEILRRVYWRRINLRWRRT